MAYNRKLLYTKSFPSWNTPEGDLGVFQNGSTITPIQLIASEINEPGSTITYSVTSGALPGGLILSSSGEISGTITGVEETGSINFTITATDDEGEFVTRDFNINVVVPLFQMEQVTFTTGGATGISGPSLSQAISGISSTTDDSWKNNTSFFNTSNGIQKFAIPQSGNYRVEAFGAGATARNGGYGAKISGEFSFVQGEELNILVGQKPYYFNTSGGGGGGGTFVTRSPHNTNESIVVIAGGGGGGHNGSGVSNDDASISTNGNNASNGGSGGSGGNGGSGGVGGGGGGFFTNGSGSYSGSAYVNGGSGGNRGSGGDGGFGGGAGHGNSHAGGGGGYSGGGGASSSPYHGGGGGSYNNGSNQLNEAGVSSADGKVIITKL